MAVKPKRGGLKGAGKVRRMLNALPETCRAEIVQELNTAGPILLNAARAETPRKTGRLFNALSFKVFPKSMRLQVGLRGRKLNRDLFYGHILEVGRKAKVVSRRSRSGNRHPYTVSPISPGQYDIVGPRTKRLARFMLRPALNRAFEKALRRAAAQGGSND
jgi:hypothetical protein